MNIKQQAIILICAMVVIIIILSVCSIQMIAMEVTQRDLLGCTGFIMSLFGGQGQNEGQREYDELSNGMKRYKQQIQHDAKWYTRYEDASPAVYSEIADGLVDVSISEQSKRNHTYVGGWQNGRPNGYGITQVYKQRIGPVKRIDWEYFGDFFAGVRNGFGTYRLYGNHEIPFDIVYTGEWKNDKYDGKGELAWHKEDGNHYYIGNWKDNEPDGVGYREKPAGEFAGIWKKGKHTENTIWAPRDTDEYFMCTAGDNQEDIANYTIPAQKEEFDEYKRKAKEVSLKYYVAAKMRPWILNKENEKDFNQLPESVQQMF